jgi:predicted ATPase
VQPATRYAFDNVELLVGERRLLIDGRPQSIGTRAFQVLLALLVHRERVVSKEELLDAVWPNLVVEQNNVAVQIAAVRKLLGAEAISTVAGRGYKFSGGAVRVTAAGAPAATGPRALPPADTATHTAAPTLIGRATDLRRLAELLSPHRAVALTGPGGVGKTCLAQRLLCDVAHRYPHGTVWIDLAPAGDELTIVDTLARTLGIDLRTDDPLESLLQSLQPRQVLVVIDHVEVAPDAAARVVQILMRRAPGLTFLLSGQMRLRLRDEQVVRLGGLAVPGMPVSPAEAMAFGAVSLYAARARSADASFTLDDHNIEAVVDLCRRLEGIPLAIDHAATRRMPDESPVRTAPLRQAIARSHDLLSDRERTLLRRLSVFEHDFPLELVFAVVADDPRLDTWAVLDALTELVDRSIVIVDPVEPPRYRLLACTRHFAAEQLELANEGADTHRRLAAALASLGGTLPAARPAGHSPQPLQPA